jgi:hypothetical protein
MVLDGGCLCQAIRYRIVGEPTVICHCHCTMCRRASGAPVVAWATFKPAELAFTRGNPKYYASSSRARRQFCPACGTQLTFQLNVRAETEIDVTLASFDEPRHLPVREHVYASTRLPWVHVDEHLPVRPEPSAGPKP